MHDIGTVPPVWRNTGAAPAGVFLALVYIASTGCTTDDDTHRPNVRAPGHEYFLPYTAGSAGLFLVNAGDFDHVIAVETAAVEHPHVLYSVTGMKGGSLHARQHVMVYAKDGEWYRVSLEVGRPQTRSRLGSGSAQDLCYSKAWHTDLADPDAGLLLYVTRGADRACGGDDDRAFVLPLGGDGDTVPREFPGLPLAPIYDAAGRLEAVLAGRINPKTLLLVLHPSGEASALGTSGRIEVVAIRHGAAFVRIGDRLHRVTRAAGLSPPLHEMSPEFDLVFSQALADSAHLYFAEESLHSGTRVPSRLWRLRTDATADAELIHEFEGEAIDFLSLSDDRVWLFNSQGAVQLLRWFDKRDMARLPELAERIEAGGIATAPGGPRTFLSIQDAAEGVFAAKIVDDLGTVLLARTNALIAGHTAAVPEEFDPNSHPTSSHALWIQGNERSNVAGGTRGVRGADLVSCDLATQQVRRLWTIDREAYLFAYAIGHVGLGRMLYVAARDDVFAFDAEDGRFKVIAITPDTQEIPIH